MPDFDFNAYIFNLIRGLQDELNEAVQANPSIGHMEFENLWMGLHIRFFEGLLAHTEVLRLPEHAISRTAYFGKALKLQLFYSIRPDLQELNNFRAMNDVFETYKRTFPS